MARPRDDLFIRRYVAMLLAVGAREPSAPAPDPGLTPLTIDREDIDIDREDITIDQEEI